MLVIPAFRRRSQAQGQPALPSRFLTRSPQQNFVKNFFGLGMTAYAFESNTQEVETDFFEFEATLGYIMRLCLKSILLLVTTYTMQQQVSPQDHIHL